MSCVRSGAICSCLETPWQRNRGSGRRTSPFPAQPRGSLPAPEHRHEALMELQHKLLVCLLFVFRINQSCLEEALDNISLCVALQKSQLQLFGAARALPLTEALVSQEGMNLSPFEPQERSLHPSPHLWYTHLHPTLGSSTQQLLPPLSPASSAPPLSHTHLFPLGHTFPGCRCPGRLHCSTKSWFPLCLLQLQLLGLGLQLDDLPKPKEWIRVRGGMWTSLPVLCLQPSLALC